jgi:hypothetical protein
MTGTRDVFPWDHPYMLKNRLYQRYNSYFDSEILAPKKLSCTGNISGDKSPVSPEKLRDHGT